MNVIRKIIQQNIDTIPATAVIGLKVKNKGGEEGSVIDYCNHCQVATMKFRNKNFPNRVTTISSNFAEIIAPKSSWKFSIKQLESRFGYLLGRSVTPATQSRVTTSRTSAVKNRKTSPPKAAAGNTRDGGGAIAHQGR